MRHVNEPAPDIRELRSDVPPRLAEAIDKALQKDPARRFPTMRAFAEELRACLAEAGSEGATQVIRDAPGGAERRSARAGASGRSGTSQSPCLSVSPRSSPRWSSAAAAGRAAPRVRVRAPARVTSYDPAGQESAVLRQYRCQRDRRQPRDGVGHPDLRHDGVRQPQGRPGSRPLLARLRRFEEPHGHDHDSWLRRRDRGRRLADGAVRRRLGVPNRRREDDTSRSTARAGATGSSGSRSSARSARPRSRA